MKSRALCWLLLALLLLRTALLIRAAAWAPMDYVGDFATDYHPRAQYLAEHGRLPTHAELAGDLYLRPPGTSMLLAIPIATGLDWRGVIYTNRIANLLLDGLLLGAILVWLCSLRAGSLPTGALGMGLLVQPWTAGFALLPGSDTLNMVVLTMAVYAAANVFGQGTAGPRPRIAAWILGLSMGVSLLLRGETLAWLGLLGLWSGWLIWRNRRACGPVLLRCWVPIIATLGLCAAYSSHVRDDPNLWRADHQSFAGNGVNRWLGTWPGNEQTKSRIAFYWFRGLNLSMDYVPVIALRAADQEARIRAALAQTPAGQPMPESAQMQFAQMAEENRLREPWMASVLVPMAHVGTMLLDASAHPEIGRLLGRLSAPLMAVVPLVLQAAILTGLVLLLLRWDRLKRWPGSQSLALVAGAALAARLGLFAMLLNYPENRYLLPCWPLLLSLSLLGWLAATTRASAMPHARLLLPSTPV